MKPIILVVDDDPGVRYTLRQVLEDADMQVFEAGDGAEALAWLSGNRADLIVSDLAMPVLDGLGLLRELAGKTGAPRLILITAHGSERAAVEAMKLGAYDYFAKPFDIDAVLLVIERAVGVVRQEQVNEQLRAELHLARTMVFASDVMRRIALLVWRIAPKDVTVLISGPSGTGKELLAEAIVAGSPRASRPFVRFNCAAVPRELVEAELFGHSRGAFTGAHKARAGLFREADGGTLLLDEVGEMDQSTQGKLLRVLQEGKLRPVGEDRELPVDVRLLAATNRDLELEISEGRFREDLFYRLNVVRIHLPSLAERLDDLHPLIEHFLRKHGERFGCAPVSMPPGLLDQLCRASYPGNVRQLENQIERLVALSPPGRLGDLGEIVEPSPLPDSKLGLRQRVEAFERGLIVAELKRCKGNRSMAARQLGIGRVTLLDKIKKYGLE
jgi:two-component system response regulator HydG